MKIKQLWFGWLVLGLLLLAPPRWPAAELIASHRSSSSSATMNPVAAMSLYGGFWDWWDDTKQWFSQQASNRTRVVQFGLAGMVIALFILWSASQRKR